MTTLVGLHGRADGPLQDADFVVITTARIAAVKLLSTAAGADVDRLGREHPDIRIVVRCFADFRGRTITAQQFAQAMAGDLVPFYQRGLREFEIHNEPNLIDEGWGDSWADGAAFGEWFNAVRLALSNTFPGCRWGWPGLSPGITGGQRTDSEQFMAAAGSHVAGADWIGLHCYWIDEQTYADAVHQVQLVRARYPGKKIYVTEFANPAAGVSMATKSGQYLCFYKDMAGLADMAFAFVASASDPAFAAQAWRDESGRPSAIPVIVGARPEEAPVIPPPMTAVIKARGLDVSDFQDPAKMRYQLWRDTLGFCFLYYQVARGLTPTPRAAAHRAAGRTAGYLTGPYMEFQGWKDARAQARLLVASRGPNDELPDFAAIELQMTEPQLRAFCDEHDLSGIDLTLYTGYGVWESIVPSAARARYAKYKLVFGGYPFDAPEGRPGGQPMDLVSVALRSNPPAHATPLLPDPWVKYWSWQHTGHGRLFGYDGDLDLEVSAMSEAELRASVVAPAPAPTMPIDETPTGFKLSPGQVGNGQLIDFCRAARAAGAPFRASFGMDNAGLAIDAAHEQLTTYWLTRIVQGATDACPGMDAEPGQPAATSAQMKTMARDQIVAYQRLNDQEKLLDGQGKARVKILPWNEPAPATLDGHLRLAELMSYTVEASAAAGFHCLVFCWNAGTPQPDYWRAVVGTGINELLLATGNGICFHFGVLGQPGIPDSVSDTVDDSLLAGTWLENKQTGYKYYLPGADALVLRHRMFKRIAAEEGRPIAPLWGTELYVLLKGITDYEPAEVVRRLTWVEHQLAQDEEVVAGFPYAIGKVGVGLPRNDHSAIWPLLIPVAVSVKNRKNAARKDELMPITAAKKKSMHDAATVLQAGVEGLLVEIDALVVDDAPAKHTMATLTNQQVINLFNLTAKLPLSVLEAQLTGLQKATLYFKDTAGNRSALYTGPALEDMKFLTPAQLALVLAALGG